MAPEPIAVEEGVKVFMQGGNAIDAAVTCALVQGVVNPHMSSIGGYLVLNLYTAGQLKSSDSHSIILDAPALAGSKVTPSMWQDLFIRPNPEGWGYFLKGQVNDLGYQSICSPGAVKGLATMLERWGSISWAQAVEPAARIAEEGFLVDSYLAQRWRRKAKYPEGCSLADCVRRNAETKRIYIKEDETLYDAGDKLRNPDYAGTLRGLSQHGPEDFYQGQLAQRMAQDFAANGGFLTPEDLADYRLRHCEACLGSYRGHTIVTSPPPHGGPTLAAILHILEGYDVAAFGHNSPQYIYLVAMAMKAAFSDRNQCLGDPEFVDVDLEWMLSKQRAQQWRDYIDRGEPIDVSFTPPEPPDTTHVNVVDEQGNLVSLTHSLGYSSGVITPGLGFMYNNSMANFHPLPGHPNSIAPQKGRTTGMTPTIVYQGEKPLLVIGAPGATRIITSILQVIMNVIDFGMSISDAVLAPRFHCQDDWIRCQARVPEYVCEEVRQRHAMERLPESHGGLALVHAVHIDPETGNLTGAADSGSGGMAIEV